MCAVSGVSALATWYKELTHLKRPWCWERLKAGGEGDDRGWDGWMASPTRWTWVWATFRSWWWTGKPDTLQSMELQRVGHDCAIELTVCSVGIERSTAWLGVKMSEKLKEGHWTWPITLWDYNSFGEGNHRIFHETLDYQYYRENLKFGKVQTESENETLFSILKNTYLEMKGSKDLEIH